MYHTLIKTFQELYIKRYNLLKTLFIPLILLVIIDSLNMFVKNIFQIIVSSTIEGSIYCIIAILTHRIIILGPNSVPKFGLYKPTTREFSFFFHFLGVSLITLPFILFLFNFGRSFIGILMPIASLFYLYLLSRVSLVFPAIAIDEGWSYTDSWRVTANYQLYMIGVVVVFPILVGLPTTLISMLFSTSIVYIFASTIGTVVIIAALSCAYQHLKHIDTEFYQSYQNESTHCIRSDNLSSRQAKIPNFKLWKAILIAVIVITSLNLTILYSEYFTYNGGESVKFSEPLYDLAFKENLKHHDISFKETSDGLIWTKKIDKEKIDSINRTWNRKIVNLDQIEIEVNKLERRGFIVKSFQEEGEDRILIMWFEK